MCRESRMETQRTCTLQVNSHLKCCQNTGSFQCHRTVVSGHIHLGENLGRQGLLGTLHTLWRSPCHTSAAFPHLRSRLSCLRPQHRAALRSCCQAPAQASARGMLPRPGLPEQGSWQQCRAKFGGKRLGSSPDKAEGQGGGSCTEQSRLKLGSSRTAHLSPVRVDLAY